MTLRNHLAFFPWYQFWAGLFATVEVMLRPRASAMGNVVFLGDSSSFQGKWLCTPTLPCPPALTATAAPENPGVLTNCVETKGMAGEGELSPSFTLLFP